MCLWLEVDRPSVNSTHVPLALLEAMVGSSDLLHVSDSGAQDGGTAAIWGTLVLIRGQKH